MTTLTPPPLVKTPYLTSYIAHLRSVRDYHRDAREDLTSRGFPCLLSNDVLGDELREYPSCSKDQAKITIANRISLVRDNNLAFFILFMDDSQHDEIAAFELGLAIQNPATKMILIGARPRNNIHCIEDSRIILAYDYENFAAQRYFDPK